MRKPNFDMFSANKFIKFKCLIITYILCTLKILTKLCSPASHITRSKAYVTVLSPGSRSGPKRWGEWSQVSAQGNWWIPTQPTSPSQLPLYTRNEALGVRVRHTAAWTGWGVVHGESVYLTHHDCLSYDRKVLHDSLLRQTEGSICWLDPSHRDICCLFGVQVGDVTKKLSSLVQPSNYHPLLVFQVCSNEVPRSLRNIKRDFTALE